MKTYLLLLFVTILFIFIPLSLLFSQETGDVNNDGSVNIIDALLVAQYYVGLDPAGFYPELADVNCDNTVDILDALMIAHYYVGNFTEFPDCSATPAPTDPPGDSTPTTTPAVEPTPATPTPAVEPTPSSQETATPTPDPTSQPADRMYITPNNIDFGTISSGQMAVEPLIIENTSSESFTITSITLSPANLFSWGLNSNGQLGVILPEKTSTAIRQSIELENVVSVDTFYNSTFFITEGGGLWACGRNGSGQLGDGTVQQRSVPVMIVSEGVEKVSCSLNHTLILKTDGSLWGCGSTSRGILGLEDTSVNTRVPVQIMASGVKDIAAGGAFSYVLKDDGSLWSFGVNYKGQLGLGDTEDRLTPVQVNIGNVAKIAAGWNNAMAIKTDGSLWACGQNTDGELGDGTNTDSSVFVKVIDSGVVDVKPGAQHTLALLTGNALVGCGNNELGQLGTGWISGSTSFISIATNVVSMDAGSLHTLYIKTDGSLWGCGSNGLYQLADEIYDDKLEPIMIYDSGVVGVAGGYCHSIALRIPTEMVFSHNADYPVPIYGAQEYSFDITMESATEGSFGGVIAIETDIPEKPLIHIPVWGNVSP